jgi:hypothetical protein
LTGFAALQLSRWLLHTACLIVGWHKNQASSHSKPSKQAQWLKHAQERAQHQQKSMPLAATLFIFYEKHIFAEAA